MRKKSLVISSAALIFPAIVQAQSASSIDVGGFELIPKMSYRLKHDDNIIRSSDVEIETWVATIVPELLLKKKYKSNSMQFGYKLLRGDYFSSQIDNYTDHIVTGDFNFELSSKHKVVTSILWQDTHEDRGTGYSIGNGELLSEPDRYQNSKIDVVYSYGSEDSLVGLDFLIDYEAIDFDIDSLVYRIRDRDISTLGAIVSYRVAPLTEVTTEYYFRQIEYDFTTSPENSLDSDENLIRVGINWESTAQTTGYAKIGYREKKFETGSRDDFSGIDWRVGIEWLPLSYSRFNFSTFTNTNETNGEGSFIKALTHRASWTHDWLARLSTQFIVDFRNNKYEGVDGTTVREDDNVELTAGITYEFKRWLSFDLKYITNDRTSSREDIEFDREQIMLAVNVTL